MRKFPSIIIEDFLYKWVPSPSAVLVAFLVFSGHAITKRVANKFRATVRREGGRRGQRNERGTAEDKNFGGGLSWQLSKSANGNRSSK